MAHTLSVDSIFGSFLYLTPPKQLGKPDYASIWDTHRPLTANAESTKSPHGGDQNYHIGLVLTATQYMLVIQTSFIRLTDHGQTTTIPAWKAPFDEKKIIWEHAEKRRQYDEIQKIDSALCNKLLTTFKDTHPPPLKQVFMGYSATTTLQLIGKLYS